MQLRRLLLLLMVLGIVMGGWVLLRRPPNAPVVEIALDDASARRFAERQGYPYDQLLAEFKAAGVTTLLVGERTLGSLLAQGQTGLPDTYPVEIAVFRGHELAGQGMVSGIPLVTPAEVRLEETYLVVRRNPDLARWLEHTLKARLGAGRVRRLPLAGPAVGDVPAASGALAAAAPGPAPAGASPGPVPGNPPVVVLGVWADPGPSEAPWQGLMGMPLGILPADLEAAGRHGLRVAYSISQRPAEEGVPPYRPADLAAVVTLPGSPGLVWVEGSEVPGYPENLALTARRLQEQGGLLALGRNRSGTGPALPAGMSGLVSLLGQEAVKGYRVSYTDRVTDWVTAVKDRNIRFFIFEAFTLSLNGEQDVQNLTTALAQFVAGVHAYGFSTGAARPAGPYSPPGWALALLGLAAAAATVALLERFWSPGRGSPSGLTLAWVAGAALLLLGVPVLVLVHPAGAQGAALLAAVAVPSLGVLAAAARGLRAAAAGQRPAEVQRLAGRDWWQDAYLGLRMVLSVALYGTAAGVLVHALLADRRFWLEIDLFRGVKIELVAPVVVFLAHWAWQQRAGVRRQAKAWLEKPLRYRTVLVATAVLLAVGMLLLRSEYAGAQVGAVQVQAVSGVELWLREGLEQALYARPRFKEFLVGYPALFLAAFLLRRGARTWGLAAVAAGAVAGASVANSFSHAHVPPGLTLLRVAHGLWLGVLGGALLIGAFYLARRGRRDVDA